MFLCFADLVDHAVQYAGANPSSQTVLWATTAAQTAMKVLSTNRDWQWYNTLGMVNVQGPYSTGTIQYTQATRQAVLTGGTWPSWAAYGYLVFANSTYQVVKRVSDTVLLLSPISNPGADVAAGTAFNLRQDTYTLPENFLKATSAVVQPGIWPMQYVTDATALTGRNFNVGTGRPQYFAVISDPLLPQRLAVRLWPSPNEVYHIQFTFRRKTLTPIYQRQSTGLVTTTASSTAVTGTGTNFVAGFDGAVLRVSNDAATLPTGTYGENPAQAEFIIDDVSAVDAMTVTEAAIETLIRKKFVITSLLDVDPEGMLDYIWREVEKQYRLISRMKSIPEEIEAYMMAYQRACVEDNRYSGRQTAGPVVRAGVFDFVTVIPQT